MKKGDIVQLVKMSDNVFGGIHPKGIDVGYTQIGELIEDVKVGEMCTVINRRRFNDYLSTSIVTEIISENVFKTENSTYTIFPYEYPKNFLNDEESNS